MKLTYKNIIRSFIVLLALNLLQLETQAAETQEIEALLGQFVRNPSESSANRFMNAIYEEQFIDSPIRFTAQMPLDTMKQQVYYWGGEWLYSQQRYEDARSIALMALPLFHPNNDGRADCLNLLGIIYVRLGDFSNAANYAKQCLEMDMKSGDDDRISSSMNTVAGIYMAANQPKEAEKYILGAIDHSGRVNNPRRQAVILGMASEIYHKLGDDAKALPYAEQAYSIDSLLNREPQATIRLSQKGYALLGLERYQEAEEVFSKVLPVLKDNGDQHSYAIALNNMGRTLLQQDRHREAIDYYKQASTILSGMGDLYNEIHSHRGLYESYWEINPDSAKIELERFSLLKDSLYSHSTAESLSRYNAEFGNELLQKENSEMRKEHQRELMVGAAILVIILLVSWLIIRSIRRRHQLRMQKLLAEIEKLRADADVKQVEECPAPTVPVVDAPKETDADNENKQFLKRVIDAVNSAMANGSVSVAQIASDLNMGEQSFRRRLQSAAGETPKDFFMAIRMERASSLLAGCPDIPVSKVAELCGFENVSSFGHAFKRMYDYSPSQYREKILAE